MTGERGIGKSSLAAFIRRLAERDANAIGCHVRLGGVREVPEMLRRTLHRLLNESVDKPWHGPLTNFLGNRIRRTGPFGLILDLNLTRNDLENLARNFVPAIRNLLKSLPKPKRTILLVLDDINGLAKSAAFAHWLKSSVDEFATSAARIAMDVTETGGGRAALMSEGGLCILVVGPEERRRELLAGQPSLDRVFDIVDIAPWSDQEVADFYGRTFARRGATLSRPGMRRMVRSTRGLPVLAHKIGDAVWRSARTPDITTREIATGIRLATPPT